MDLVGRTVAARDRPTWPDDRLPVAISDNHDGVSRAGAEVGRTSSPAARTSARGPSMQTLGVRLELSLGGDQRFARYCRETRIRIVLWALGCRKGRACGDRHHDRDARRSDLFVREVEFTRSVLRRQQHVAQQMIEGMEQVPFDPARSDAIFNTWQGHLELRWGQRNDNAISSSRRRERRLLLSGYASPRRLFTPDAIHRTLER